jgi:CheY-like chemotaxis protein
VDASAGSGPPADAEPAFERPLRLLLAEDNLVNRRLVEVILAQEGWEVVSAQDGREALAAWRGARFDVVLMDVQMPTMDGFEATRRMRAEEVATGRPRTPVIALTAHAMRGDRERCLEGGMDGYVAKPLGREALLAAIRDARLLGAPEPAIDLGPLRKLLKGDETTLEMLVRAFLETVPAQLAELARAVSARDVETAARCAHSLKGAVANFGAERACALAMELERAARSDPPDLCPDLCHRFAQEVGRAAEDLRAQAAPSAAS